MPTMKLSIPHSLSQDEALSRIKNLVTEVKAKFADKVSHVKEFWQGNTGEFDLVVMGLSVSGVIKVEETSLQIEGKLPFAAMPFKGKIESTLMQKAKDLLA